MRTKLSYMPRLFKVMLYREGEDRRYSKEHIEMFCQIGGDDLAEVRSRYASIKGVAEHLVRVRVVPCPKLCRPEGDAHRFTMTERSPFGGVCGCGWSCTEQQSPYVSQYRFLQHLRLVLYGIAPVDRLSRTGGIIPERNLYDLRRFEYEPSERETIRINGWVKL